MARQANVQINNVVLEKKHYYMQLMQNTQTLRKDEELEVLSDDSSQSQLTEIMRIWNYTFAGLLREGLAYDYIKNSSNPDKDIIRITIDNIHYDCLLSTVKRILKDDFDTVVQLENANVSYSPTQLSSISSKTKEVEKESGVEPKEKVIVKEVIKEDPEIKAAKEKAEEEAKQFKYLAYHDELTKLKNRKAFAEDIEKVSQQTACVISIDANNLKITNDTFGHRYGDELLLKIAEVFTSEFEDKVYRTGGDEFSVLLDGIGKAIVDKKLANIKNSLKVASEASKEGIEFSVAIGYAFGDGSLSLKELIDLADRKMYKNKKEFKAQKTLDAKVVPTERYNESLDILTESKELSDSSDIFVDKIQTNVPDKTIDYVEDEPLEEEADAPLSITNDAVKTFDFYNSHFEKMKSLNTFVYDEMELSIFAPGAPSGDKIRAFVAPLKLAENDAHPDIFAVLIAENGHKETFVSKENSSLRITFEENEMLIRSTFKNGEFATYVALSGTTYQMGYNINKEVIEHRSIKKEDANYGHIVYGQDDFIVNLIPITLDNDINGMAPSLICIEDKNTKEKEVFLSSKNAMTVFSHGDKSYQLLTYWQENLLLSEILMS